jgi:hypothetical protein
VARDERTYDRRVLAYLDAVDFLERCNQTFAGLENPPGSFLEDQPGIPYTADPPTRLTSRLGAFGSSEAVKAFEEAQRRQLRVPRILVTDESGKTYLDPDDHWHVRRERDKSGMSVSAGPRLGFTRRLAAFRAQLDRFEAIVHEEIG